VVVVLVLKDVAGMLSEEQLIHFLDASAGAYLDGLPCIHVLNRESSVEASEV
jgi:hypothetical protein